MIVFCHLLNDNSGSPRVLRDAIKTIAGADDMLFVGAHGDGLLSNTGLTTRKYWYWRTGWRIPTLFTYLASQVFLYRALRRCAKDIPQDAIIYVNTLLPFGAALWARRNRRRVLWHVHEISISPAPLRWALIAIASRTADRLIYVSQEHRSRLPIGQVSAGVVHNAISEELFEKAQSHEYVLRRDGVFRVLMLASLRRYKGIPEFMALARAFAHRNDIRFVLVANEAEPDVRRYLAAHPPPENMDLHPRTDDPARYYRDASVLLNLSRPDMWVETFGLSVAEAMGFGIPVIAPPVGGPAEILRDGIDGFLIDSRETKRLCDCIGKLADDKDLCLRLSQNARDRSREFAPQRFRQRLAEQIVKLSGGT